MPSVRDSCGCGYTLPGTAVPGFPIPRLRRWTAVFEYDAANKQAAGESHP